MSVAKKAIDDSIKKFGPIPKLLTFGDGIDWDAPLVETFLYVELPFWLMVPAGDVHLKYEGVDFTVTILGPWQEVFAFEFTDSRITCFHQGPATAEPYEPQGAIGEMLRDRKAPVMSRPCQTVLRITTQAHLGPFQEVPDDQPPRATAENDRYMASLCEAHIPVINELIQRYRLQSYDYFAMEVSAWDVPVWYLKQGDDGHRTVLLLYRAFDRKPNTVEEPEIDGGTPISPCRDLLKTGRPGCSCDVATSSDLSFAGGRGPAAS